jgi:hypothetical protein
MNLRIEIWGGASSSTGISCPVCPVCVPAPPGVFLPVFHEKLRGSASQCSVGLCLGCDSVTNTTSPQCLRNPIAVSPDISAIVRGHRCSLSSS